MDFPDHYTSHKFRHLYWTAFERFIDKENASVTQPLNEDENSSDEADTEENGNSNNPATYDYSMHDEDELTIPIQRGVVNGTGNPRVSPVPVKPVGIAAGTGFDGYGLRVCVIKNIL